MKQKSLQKVLTREITVFVVVVMAIVLGTVAIMMTSELQRELKDSMASEVFHIEEVLENYLTFQKENIAGFSKNHLVTNSLIDSSGRDKYLPSLIDSFLEARKVAALTVVDFEGKIILSSMEQPPDYLLADRLRLVLEAGRSLLELDTLRQRIIFTEPILFYQTPQGAVIMEIDLETFVKQSESQKKDLYLGVLRQKEIIYTTQPSQGDFIKVRHAFSSNSLYLQELGISLEIGTHKSSYLNLVKKVLSQLSLLALIIILLSVLLAERVAGGIAKPILTLCQRVKDEDLLTNQKYGPLGTNNELDELAEAFDDRNLRLSKELEERHRAEQRTALAFERFKVVMDGIDALVYVADMETYEILFINKYGQKQIGEVTGKICWQQLQGKQGGPCSFCTNDKLLDADGYPTDVLVWEIQNSVDHKWYQCRDQAIRWTDNRLVRIEIAVDITQQKETEEALADEKERLAVTLRSIGDGVITTDTDGNIVLINKVAEKLTGWSQQEAFGRKLEEVFHIVNEKTRQPCESPVDKVMATGMVVGLANHTVLIAKDGREMIIADSGAPIRDRESRIIGTVLVFRDTTEAVKMEKQVLKSKKLESVGVLAGGIAHDFNNMLTAILGNVNLALIDDTLTEKTKKLLTEAEKASIRAKDLTQQLLTFSKGGEPVKQTASIKEIIRDSANFILHGSSIACSYDIPEDLWSAEVDKGQISQVIQNIILNAKQAMPMGGNIEVSCENVLSLPTGMVMPHNDSYISICIQDSGIGLQEEFIENIFDPYFTTKKEGSGLGLAVTQSIVNKHDGHISVQSELGKGTTFTIYLPALGVSQQRKIAPKEKALRQIKPLRVMVMDDDEQIRELAMSMLSVMGHEVIPVRDGDEAIKIFADRLTTGNHIDIIFMDLTIPGGMGGKEAVQEILKLDSKAKVIVSSGYSYDPILANYSEYGFCSAIVKPFRLRELSKVIDELMT